MKWAAALAIIPGLAMAETSTVTASYTMGGSDTWDMVHDACIVVAERRVLEDAGVVIQADTDLLQTETTSKAVEHTHSVTGGIVRAEVLNYVPTMDNGRVVAHCTVRVTYDLNIPGNVAPIMVDARSVRRGMTEAEVLKEFGVPKAVFWRAWNYGDVWIRFVDSTPRVVECPTHQPTYVCLTGEK